jgi:hypothetical protein
MEDGMAEDYQDLLARRAAVADEITEVIGRLGTLLREEVELQDTLRRAAERDGSRTNPFSTASTVVDAINSELTRAGISPRRADPRFRLTALVDDQNRRYRSQWAVRAQAAGQAAA